MAGIRQNVSRPSFCTTHVPQYDLHPPLDEADLLPDPLAQFERWLADAGAAGMIEPTAMGLATVAADGRPSLRIVLFRGLYQGGFCFYTNYESRKGEELAARPQAALTFWWDRLERQVRVEGQVRQLSAQMSDAYFHGRPRGSQLGAYASRQSKVVSSRAELEARVAAATERFEGQQVPRPVRWGGYCVIPDHIEFWQGRINRVHDRLRYLRDGSGWRLERLEP
jgi:pyridoxamine 5'-phosphate oxidase